MANPPSSRPYTIRTAGPTDIPLLADIERSAGQIFRTVGLDAVADDDPMPPEVLSSYLEAGNLWVAVADNRNSTDEGRGDDGDGQRTRVGAMELVGFLAAFAITVTGSAEGKGVDSRDGLDDNGEGEKERGSQDGTERRKVLMHIAELSVHASHHRRGLGKRLMRSFEEAVISRSSGDTNGNNLLGQRKSNVLGLSLTTYKDIAFNGPFYSKLGFEHVPPSRIKDVVGKRGRELWDEEQGKITMPERRCWMVKWLR